MNKFYEKYKDLFPSPNTKSNYNPYIKPSYYDYSSKQFVGMYANKSKNKMEDPIQNQMKSFFKRYAKREMSLKPNLKETGGPAAKQFQEVVLPKLKMYDKEYQQQITKTETLYSNLPVFSKNHYFNDHSLNNRHELNNYHSQFNINNSTNEHYHKYNKGNPIKKSYQNSFSKYYQGNQDLSFLGCNQRGRNSRTLDGPYCQLNPEDSLGNKFPDCSRKDQSRVLLMQTDGTSQTEYQLQYGKKRTSPYQSFEDKLKQQRQLETRQDHKIYRNFKPSDNEFQHQFQKNKQVLKFKSQLTIKNQSSPANPHNQLKMNQAQERSQKPQTRRRIRTQAKQKQDFLLFSQYSNQFQFMNRRLQDIQQFNNYYHHTSINPYKRAILRRLEANNIKQQRRDKLRYILAQEQ